MSVVRLLVYVMYVKPCVSVLYIYECVHAICWKHKPLYPTYGSLVVDVEVSTILTTRSLNLSMPNTHVC